MSSKKYGVLDFIDERAVWEPLSLIDQIHLWALTGFRDFVMEHLRPWHAFCDENHLPNWDSVYDTGPERKRRRTCDETGALPIASWVNMLSDKRQQRIQDRAKCFLAKATIEHEMWKGKGKATDIERLKYGWFAAGCPSTSTFLHRGIFRSSKRLPHVS